ncbi:hypothetical protein HPB48_018153 [Haemaphysalis longicornis]|uniref:Metalloprotease n=1 Tax=Haemaphysalis longicornis TaxID=44386 RepID=A0A9J6FVJ8_HAELO|nr:hypothetical protein HPB48_018153 [Haemaphysalis longicornis]
MHRRDVQPPENLLYYARILGRNFEMNLKRNQALVTRKLSIVRKMPGGRDVAISLRRSNCHYLGVNGSVVAAFSECDLDGGISGVILLPEEALQVKPVPSRLRHLVPDHDSGRELPRHAPGRDRRHPSRAVRSTPAKAQGDRKARGQPRVLGRKQGSSSSGSRRRTTSVGSRKPSTSPRTETRPADSPGERQGDAPVYASGSGSGRRVKFLELAVFVDEKAYLSFLRFLGDERRLMDFILGYLNQVQAIYVQPSLREKIYISLVHLELQVKQPASLRWAACATVTTTASSPRSAPRVTRAKPYASAGWTSAYVAAHEIGHKDACHSGCLDNARGFSRDRRRCDRPRPRNTARTCRGDALRTKLCDDSKICKRRENPVLYASRKCAEWKTLVRDLSSKGAQVRHNPSRPWQACAVYCKINNGPWYTPRTELNDLGGSFFPDGSWCHNDGRRDFYCQNHVCQPEPSVAESSKGRSLWLQDVDVEPRLGNARPLAALRASPSPVYEAAFIYEGDASGPVGIVQTTHEGAGFDDVDDHEYADKDYVTLPGTSS